MSIGEWRLDGFCLLVNHVLRLVFRNFAADDFLFDMAIGDWRFGSLRMLVNWMLLLMPPSGRYWRIIRFFGRRVLKLEIQS